jgi:hypothetical protein
MLHLARVQIQLAGSKSEISAVPGEYTLNVFVGSEHLECALARHTIISAGEPSCPELVTSPIAQRIAIQSHRLDSFIA